jgi:hypothetical protein
MGNRQTLRARTGTSALITLGPEPIYIKGVSASLWSKPSVQVQGYKALRRKPAAKAKKPVVRARHGHSKHRRKVRGARHHARFGRR